MEAAKATRRRGTALEDAILEAAWSELAERGYVSFTLEGVAKRAGTSRPVLSRRWPSRAVLATAAMQHHLTTHPVVVPDLGSVREELLVLLRELSARGAPTLATIMLNMSEYFAETRTNYDDLRSGITGPGMMDDILSRGIARGEIDAGKVTPRIASLPIDLARHEVMMSMAQLEEATIREIIDEVFLPLVSPDRRSD